MKKAYILIFLAMLTASTVNAQRLTDNLDRGLVAVNMDGSTFLSWRILADEYFGVTYNVYRDGAKITEGLTVSNYTDSSVGTNYTVSAVIDGVEKAQSMAISPWTNMDTGGIKTVSSATYPGYIDIELASIKDRSNTDVTSQYVANDAIFADLNGDGDLEFIIKRMNMTDANNLYPESNTTAFDVIEAYDLDYSTGRATRMWWIDVGPNMVSLNSTEINFLAYDWDEDGIAEVVLRGADNMIVHTSTGESIVIGTPGVNTRGTITHAANATFTNTGKEYLIYLNGQTGETYQVMEYPLKRIEDSEYNAWSGTYTEAQMEQKAWGTGILGHRSSKYYMGAPFLDGRSASLFLARGIYTRHKMIAMDLGSNHQWQTRWTWSCNDPSSDWYGQGFHNYVIADVDDDGKDEIMYGSMVIDDNGKGLHTTGYGHGDAMHVGDFDPYRPGPELYVCLEENPYWGSAYRSGTTGEIYYKYTSNPTAEELAADAKAGDDGRCMAGNFLNDYPGGEARSVGSGLISCVKDQELYPSSSSPFEWYACNFRIYWDGDLLDELLYNSSYPDKDLKLDKPGSGGGRLFTSTGCQLNNDSKCNPCFSGDVLGDWREEILMRCGTNVRLYTTTIPTTHAMPSLWFDHQYRQAMGTQMQVYNQPPHVSYFMGELENITVAPPPLTTRGRTLFSSSSTVTTNNNGNDLLMCGYDNQTYTISGQVSPRSIIINAPVWIEGNNNNNIQTTVYTHTLNCSGSNTIQGSTRLVKQGLGVLNMPNTTLTYTGNTDIWGGTVNFDGTMQNSPVWMNRHTTLNTNDGYFNNGLTMEYGATLNVGGTQVGNCSRVNISELTLNYGANVVLDVNGMGDAEHDWLNATTLNIDDSKKGVSAWENYGPEYIVPVFKLNMSSTLGNGRYPIGNVSTVNGDLSKVKIECETIDARYLSLIQEGGILYLKISDEAIANEANIEITGMAPYENVSTPYPSASSDNYYLPVVSIVANNTDGQVPTLSGTFTSLDGTVTNIGSNEEVVLFSENFESETAVSGWTHSGAPISLGSGDDGKYFLIDLGSTSTRYAYKRFSSVDVSNGCGYSIEFDLALTAGNTDPGEFCVMSKGGTNPTNYWDNYASINNNANLLFDLEGSKNSTVYNVSGTTTTTTLASETWYHVTLNVNQSARTVAWQISNGSSGTFELPTGTSTEFDGFYFVTGRYHSKAMLDNIVIKSAGDDLSSFTFPEPGTLQVTSAVEGYESGIKTFEVKYPYYKLYGKDFDQITSANIAEVLGSNWNTTAENTRWAYWSKNNSIYGENYQAYWVVNNASPIYLCNDSDPKVVWMDSNGSYPAAVMESFGVGRNSNGAGATIHVQNSGDSNTLIYYLVDNSQGNSPSTYGGFDKADDDGCYTISMNANYTLAKLYIYVPVAIHDELATTLPQTVSTTGNAHLWRNGLTSTSTWATMVVPFDMTVAQIREVFGNEVTVANLETGKGNGGQIYFETIEVETANDNITAITANEPCLIKGVTKSAPYLIMGITSAPTLEPFISNGYFSFVGTYTDLGQKAFTTDDYFFTTSGLSRVETDGITMRFKGYRGYFQGLTSNGAKNVQTVFEDSGVATEILDIPTSTRNEVYDLQGRKIPENWRLKKGVYIVNGRKVIVK